MTDRARLGMRVLAGTLAVVIASLAAVTALAVAAIVAALREQDTDAAPDDGEEPVLAS